MALATKHDGVFMNKVGLIVTALLLSSCKESTEQTYTAKYTWGHEVNSVALCNGKAAYWVDPSPAGKQVEQFYREQATRAYQPMYLTFRGHLVNRAPVGFEEDYDGIIHISDVDGYSFDLPESCPD